MPASALAKAALREPGSFVDTGGSVGQDPMSASAHCSSQPASESRGVHHGPCLPDDSKGDLTASSVTATRFKQIYVLLGAFLVFPLLYLQLPAHRGELDDMTTDDTLPHSSVFFVPTMVIWTLVAGWLCHGTIASVENAELADLEIDDGKGLEGKHFGHSDLSDGVINKVAYGFLEMLLEGKDGTLSKTCLGAALAGLDGGPFSEIDGDLSAKANTLAQGGERDNSGSSDLAAIRAQLREKLSLTLGIIGRRGLLDDVAGNLVSDDKGANRRFIGGAGNRREALDDFFKQLLNTQQDGCGPRDDKLVFAGSRDRTGALNESHDNKEPGTRPATMLSMAQHAKEIGNRYLQDRNFAAAAHCYEVACLLHPADRGGNHGSGHLAVYHCNCALACLELGRYGDAVNEGNAALVLNPPTHIAVKSLYRLAVAHARLSDTVEARRCLRRCLEFDPGNEYASVFLNRLGEEPLTPFMPEVSLTWVQPPRNLSHLGVATRGKTIRSRRGKQRGSGAAVATSDECFASEGAGCGPGPAFSGIGKHARLEKEAGLWHTASQHNKRLYLLGGWPDAGGKVDDGCPGASDVRGSDEFHVLDVENFEVRPLTGPHLKPPHACYCHTATMVGDSLVVFGGCGRAVDQPPLLMVFDVVPGRWRVPQTAGLPPRQRQGHTANAVDEDRQLCIFGGIEPTGQQRVARVYSDAHFLDVQSFTWRKLDVVGHRPPARFGHTTTNLPGNPGKLLVVGGRDHVGSVPDLSFVGSLSGLHLLDTVKRAWLQQPYSGTPPAQAFYHSACVVNDETLLLLASGGAGSPTIPLHLLNLEAWHWTAVAVSGQGPAPRIGHSATSVGGRVYVFGGLVRQHGQKFVDKNVYVLDASQACDAASMKLAYPQHQLSRTHPLRVPQAKFPTTSLKPCEVDTKLGHAAAVVHRISSSCANGGHNCAHSVGINGQRDMAEEMVGSANEADSSALKQSEAFKSGGDVQMPTLANIRHSAISCSKPAGLRVTPRSASSVASIPRIPPPLSLAGAMDVSASSTDPVAETDPPPVKVVEPQPSSPLIIFDGESDTGGSGTECVIDGGRRSMVRNEVGSSRCTGVDGCNAAVNTTPADHVGPSSTPSRDDRIAMMLRETADDDDASEFDDEGGLTFEELLEQEKAFFRMQSFPRVGVACGPKESIGSKRVSGRF